MAGRTPAAHLMKQGVHGLYVGGSSGEILLSGLSAGADGGIGTTNNFPYEKRPSKFVRFMKNEYL